MRVDCLYLHIPRLLPCRIRNEMVPTTGIKFSGRYMIYLNVLAATAALAKVGVVPHNCLWRKVVKRVSSHKAKLGVRQHIYVVRQRGLSIPV